MNHVTTGPQPAVSPALAGGVSLVEVERRHIESVLTQANWMIEGERGAAKEHFVAALSLYPGYSQAHNALGRALAAEVLRHHQHATNNVCDVDLDVFSDPLRAGFTKKLGNAPSWNTLAVAWNASCWYHSGRIASFS